jgi:hypothetical protein
MAGPSMADTASKTSGQTMPDNQEAAEATIVNESRDGVGSADHDEPYTFGARLSSTALSPFTFREYVRLQMLRGRFEDPNWPMIRDVREPLAA